MLDFTDIRRDKAGNINIILLVSQFVSLTLTCDWNVSVNAGTGTEFLTYVLNLPKEYFTSCIVEGLKDLQRVVRIQTKEDIWHILIKRHHLWLGCRPYNLWSYRSFRILSAAQLARALGRRPVTSWGNLLIITKSTGSPRLNILRVTQDPVRVLRNVCQTEFGKKTKQNIGTINILAESTYLTFSLLSGKYCFSHPGYLCCMSTNLRCNIPSRVANANHYHPLFFEGICIFVFHAVKAPARKYFMSWRDGRKWHKSRQDKQITILWGSIPGKSDRGIVGLTYGPEQTSTASKMCLSSSPSLFIVTTSHWPDTEKSGLCVTLFTLV